MRNRVALGLTAAAATLGLLLLGVCAVADTGGTRPSKPPGGAPAPATSGDAGVASDAGTGAIASQLVTWTCTASPCPWGSSQRNQALVWPAAAGALSKRLGYAVSAGIYLLAARANGADISIETGAATVHAGPPGETAQRVLATLAAGQTFHVTGLDGGDVLSVQSAAPFSYRVTLPPPASTPPHRVRRSGPHGPVIAATVARWRCNHTPGCFSDPWTGAVIPWPAWAAYQSNGRIGNVLRFVFSTRGEPLYPYMGAWAQGCEVTAEEGTAKVIEWKRGAEEWKATLLQPGESHVIKLVPPQDGALIESADDSSTFSVSLRNCTPQKLAP